jgi:hypothetical protein
MHETHDKEMGRKSDVVENNQFSARAKYLFDIMTAQLYNKKIQTSGMEVLA